MKHRKLLVSILAGILATAMILTLLVGILPIRADAKSSSEIKEEISALKDEQSAIWGQLSALEAEQDANWESIEEMVAQKDNIDQQIALLYGEIDNINAQIRAYSLLIAENQAQLDEAEARLSDLNEKNKERIRAMEEEGEISLWSVIFKAKSFSDLIDRLNMMEEIQAADQRRLAELSAAADEVAAARELLAAEKTALEGSRAELETAQGLLDEKRAEADAILTELNADKRALDAVEAEYERAEAELAAQIAAAEVEYTKAKQAEEEERRRQEEEERRRKEEEEKKNQSSSGGSGSSGGSSSSGEGWVRPCSWIALTSPYGWRSDPFTGNQSFHNGVDLAHNQGTPIYAVRSGTVTVATYNSVYGYYVTINHGDGFSSLYGHLTHYTVSAGSYVSQGQLIGYMGSTGRSTGSHLHFSIYYNGSTVNPMNYI